MRIAHLATLLAIALTSTCGWSQTAPAASAASAPAAPAIRAEVRTPLLEAQTLIGEKKFAQAKEKIQAASAIANPSPFESYIVSRVALSIAIEEDDAVAANRLLEQILQLNTSGAWLKPDESQRLMHAVGNTHYRTKDYVRSASWLDRNIQSGGTDPAVRNARIQAVLLSGNLARGSELLEAEISASEKAKETPSQTHLELLAQAKSGLKDIPGYTLTLEKLVEYYPTKEHWRSLINRLWGRSDLAIRLQLDVFRLAFYTGTPEEVNDYAEYIDFSQKAGFSAEALRMFDQGVSAGLLGTGANAEAHKKLKAKLTSEVEQDRKTMTADTAAAIKKPDGLALFNIGFNMVGMGQFEKGLDLMEKGIAKGLAKRPEDARLRLAVAYVWAGQTDKALQAFAAVSGPDGLDDLVRYWKLALRKP